MEHLPSESNHPAVDASLTNHPDNGQFEESKTAAETINSTDTPAINSTSATTTEQ